jgi:hypothetical protein
MNLSCFLGLGLFLTDCFATGPEGEGDEGEDHGGVVFDFGTSVGWFEGVLVGQFGEGGEDVADDVVSVGGRWAVGNEFAVESVEAHGHGIVASSNSLHN